MIDKNKLIFPKYPQLSKPKATVARNRKTPSGDLMEKKKTWENPGSVGGQFSSGVYELETGFNCKIKNII